MREKEKKTEYMRANDWVKVRVSEAIANERKQWKCITAQWSTVPVNKCYDHEIR